MVMRVWLRALSCGESSQWSGPSLLVASTERGLRSSGFEEAGQPSVARDSAR